MLSDAFIAPAHPLCLLLDTAVRVFQASYRGVGANRRLLTAAIQEVLERLLSMGDEGFQEWFLNLMIMIYIYMQF